MQGVQGVSRTRVGRSAAITIGALLLVAALFAARAQGATGDLTPQGCISITGSLKCTQHVDGLDFGGSPSAAFSPDGTSLYVMADASDALLHFQRNPTTGALTPQADCIKDDSSALTCPTTVNTLAQDGNTGANVVVSPDGKDVYVASSVDDAVSHFSRNTSNGTLTYADCVEDDLIVGTNCGGLFALGLEGAAGVAISDDGKSLYASTTWDRSVVHFQRNTSNGSLSTVDCIENNDPGLSTCGQSTDGLFSVRGLVVSHDGKNVYAAADGDAGSLTRLVRNPTNGNLSPGDCIQSNGSGDQCARESDLILEPRALAITPDDRAVYASSTFQVLPILSRNTSTGVLTVAGCVEDNDGGLGGCATKIDGLGGIWSVAVGPDSRTVYAGADSDNAVTWFNRSTLTGAVTPGGCVEDSGNGPDACTKSTEALTAVDFVIVSPDGKNVYALSSLDDAVVRLSRERLSASPPTKSKEVVVAPIAGAVTVRLPGTSTFVPLERLDTIPTGSLIDTRRGTVRLTSARNFAGVAAQTSRVRTQTARFRFGLFRVFQGKRRAAYTNLKLLGPLSRCRAKRRVRRSSEPLAEQARRRRHRRRRLWGRGHGRFRIRGRRGSGAARGTTWQVTDFCNGKTAIRSIRGRVTVRDYKRRRTVILRSGRRYVAPGKPRRRRR